MKSSRLFTLHQWLLVLSAPLLFGASVYYLIEIIPQLIAAFLQQATCGCETIISFSHRPLLTLFLTAVAAVSVGIIGSMLYSAIQQLRATHKHIATLDIHTKETIAFHQYRVQVYTYISSSVSIFTAGILRPRIYLSSTAMEMLTPAEKNSVLLHEIAHIAHGDVLKRLLTNTVLATLRWIPGKPHLQRSVEFAQENSADQFAARHSSYSNVMSALMKLLDSQRVMTPSSVVGFVVNEARLEYLMQEPVAFPVKMALAGVLLTVGMVISTSAVFAAGFGVLDYVQESTSALSATQCANATMSIGRFDGDEETALDDAFCSDLNSTPANMSVDELTSQ